MPAEPGVAAGSFEFDDFDRFRESISGWDTDPIQLTPGPLRLSHDFLRSGDVTVARIRANQRIADSSAIQPGHRGGVRTSIREPGAFLGVVPPAVR
jgi:hypothetical protein